MQKQTLDELILDRIIAEAQERSEESAFWELETFTDARPTIPAPPFYPAGLDFEV